MSTTAYHMSTTTPPQQDPTKSLLCAVIDNGTIALVRVVGRGNFSNAMSLKQFAGHLQKPGKTLRFILDLDECEAMDSTFMGVLACISIIQQKDFGSKLIVVNANDHCRRLLKNLGLTHLVDMRSQPVEEVERAAGEFHPAEQTEVSKLDQICLTLQAHKQLVRIDEQNEVRFQAVIEYLEKSLEEETGNCGC